MAFGTLVDNAWQPNLTHLFPTPEALAAADIGAIGLTRSRAETISVLSVAFARGEFDFTAAPSAEIEAQYIAMRALSDPDAFPEGDLALVRAMAALGEDLDGPALARRAEAWRPWRAYAAMHLWSCDPGARTKAREKIST